MRILIQLLHYALFNSAFHLDAACRVFKDRGQGWSLLLCCGLHNNQASQLARQSLSVGRCNIRDRWRKVKYQRWMEQIYLVPINDFTKVTSSSPLFVDGKYKYPFKSFSFLLNLYINIMQVQDGPVFIYENVNGDFSRCLGQKSLNKYYVLGDSAFERVRLFFRCFCSILKSYSPYLTFDSHSLN